MSVSLEFDSSHRYAEAVGGIEIPIAISNGGQSVELVPKLDTGAAHCIFERKYAELLAIDVESGRLQRFRTATGTFGAFQHEITIQTLNIEFSAVVFFAADPTFNRNFLGRSGWPDRLRVAIVDYDRMLFLNEYDS